MVDKYENSLDLYSPTSWFMAGTDFLFPFQNLQQWRGVGEAKGSDKRASHSWTNEVAQSKGCNWWCQLWLCWQFICCCYDDEDDNRDFDKDSYNITRSSGGFKLTEMPWYTPAVQRPEITECSASPTTLAASLKHKRFLFCKTNIYVTLEVLRTP